MTQLTHAHTRRQLDQLAGEMHGAFAELESQGFPLGQICYCAVEVALTRLHHQAPLAETLEWCRKVAGILQGQAEKRAAFAAELDRRAIN